MKRKHLIILALLLLLLAGIGGVMTLGDDSAGASIANQEDPNRRTRGFQQDEESGTRPNANSNGSSSAKQDSAARDAKRLSEQEKLKAAEEAAKAEADSNKAFKPESADQKPERLVDIYREYDEEYRKQLEGWKRELRDNAKGAIQSTSARPRTRRVAAKKAGTPKQKLKQGLSYFVRTGFVMPDRWPPNDTSTDGVCAQVDFPSYSSFPWQNTWQSFGPKLGDAWKATFQGRLVIEEAKTIILGFGSDIGGAVKLNGQTVLVNTQNSWYREVFAELELEAGEYDLEVTHISGPSPNETSVASACRLLYKDHWDDKAFKPVPKEWLYLPASYAYRPYIDSVTPKIVKSGDIITIKGDNFLADGNDEGPLSKEDLAVIAGMNAYLARRFQILDATNTQIKARVPAGALSGELYLKQQRPDSTDGNTSYGAANSNRVEFTIDEVFGAVVMYWDMTDRGVDVPDPKITPPDFLRVEKFPHVYPAGVEESLEGKPVAFKVFGEVASESYYPNPYVGTDPLGWRKGTSSFFDLTIDGKHLRVDQSSYGATSTIGKLIFPEGHPGREQDLWYPFEFSGYLEANEMHAGFAFYDGENEDRVTISVFRPGADMPAPPSMHLSANYATIEGVAGKLENPSVGEAFTFLITESALDNKEHPLTFRMDGKDAPWTIAKMQNGNPASVRIMAIDDYERVQTFTMVTITIPQGAVEGELIAYQGIIPSQPLEVPLASAGLVGLYYDYDGSLSQIPDNSSKTPVMRRVDKHLDFSSNAQFQLPMPAEQFAVDWYGQIYAEETGDYHFQMQSDDGARVKVGSTTVVEFAGLRAPDRSNGKIRLTKGWHDIRIQYFENFGVETFVLKWRIPLPEEEEAPTAISYYAIELKYLRTAYSPGVPDVYPSE